MMSISLIKLSQMYVEDEGSIEWYFDWCRDTYGLERTLQIWSGDPNIDDIVFSCESQRAGGEIALRAKYGEYIWQKVASKSDGQTEKYTKNFYHFTKDHPDHAQRTSAINLIENELVNEEFENTFGV